MQPKKSTDWIALGAIVAAIFAIIWGEIEIHGTVGIERALADEAAPLPAHCNIQRLEAITMNRWAGGLAQ